MKLLLDECVTRNLKREFAGHEVHTVEEAGFKGLENGDLLRAASTNYDVLITVDRNLPYQQNLTRFNIGILILSAKRNSYARLKPLMAKALSALEIIREAKWFGLKNRLTITGTQKAAELLQRPSQVVAPYVHS